MLTFFLKNTDIMLAALCEFECVQRNWLVLANG